METEITKRANQLMDCKEYGHELTWEKAIRFATEEAEEKTQEAAKRQAEKARKVALWNEYKADLRAAGASEAAIKVLAPANCEAFRDLPAFIAVGRIQFSTPEVAGHRLRRAGLSRRNLHQAVLYQMGLKTGRTEMICTYFSYRGNHINGKDSAKGCTVTQAQQALSLQGKNLKDGLKPPKVSVRRRDSFGVTYSISASKAFWRALGVNC